MLPIKKKKNCRNGCHQAFDLGFWSESNKKVYQTTTVEVPTSWSTKLFVLVLGLSVENNSGVLSLLVDAKKTMVASIPILEEYYFKTESELNELVILILLPPIDELLDCIDSIDVTDGVFGNEGACEKTRRGGK